MLSSYSHTMTFDLDLGFGFEREFNLKNNIAWEEGGQRGGGGDQKQNQTINYYSASFVQV